MGFVKRLGVLGIFWGGETGLVFDVGVFIMNLRGGRGL